MINKAIEYIKKILKEAAAQIFTALGFFLSWFLLTGSSRDFVGIMIVVAFIIWFATINFRK
jgi:hypothetical protein